MIKEIPGTSITLLTFHITFTSIIPSDPWDTPMNAELEPLTDGETESQRDDCLTQDSGSLD